MSIYVTFSDHAHVRELERLQVANYATDTYVDISKEFAYAQTKKYTDKRNVTESYDYYVYVRESTHRILLCVSRNSLRKVTTCMTHGTTVDTMYNEYYKRNNIAHNNNVRVSFARDTAKAKFVKLNKK